MGPFWVHLGVALAESAFARNGAKIGGAGLMGGGATVGDPYTFAGGLAAVALGLGLDYANSRLEIQPKPKRRKR